MEVHIKRALGTFGIWVLLTPIVWALQHYTDLSAQRIGHAQGWFTAFLVIYRHPGLIGLRRSPQEGGE